MRLKRETQGAFLKRKRKITNAKIYEDKRDLYCSRELTKSFRWKEIIWITLIVWFTLCGRIQLVPLSPPRHNLPGAQGEQHL